MMFNSDGVLFMGMASAGPIFLFRFHPKTAPPEETGSEGRKRASLGHHTPIETLNYPAPVGIHTETKWEIPGKMKTLKCQCWLLI